jgi:hypothetical protein
VNSRAIPVLHRPPAARAGTVLIIVAGISALLLSVTMAYLMNMRADLEESDLVVREAQARILLIAGLQYIQEASRLGWDRTATSGFPRAPTPEHEEAFGWTDVRDGSAGPKDSKGDLLYDISSNQFPCIGGKAARFEFHAYEQPPYAIKTTFTINPAPMDASLAWKDLVNYKNADPQPASSDWTDFELGDRRIRPETAGRSWMRIYRDKNPDPASVPTNPEDPRTAVEPATFTITCGVGATRGWKTFADAAMAGEGALFNNDATFFNLLRSQERILWFRCEWTSAAGGSSMGVRVTDGTWNLPSINQESYGGTGHWWVNRNLVGSILWIQRLEREPTNW